MKLGEKIRSLRMRKGISQAELGRLIGQNSRTFMNELEGDKKAGVTLGTLQRIARVLGTTVSQLVKGTQFDDERRAPRRKYHQVARRGIKVACL